MAERRRHAARSIKYEMHLLDINGVRLADALREGTIGHVCFRVRVTENELHLAFLDSPWLRAQIPHEEADTDANNKQAVLTMSGQQLVTALLPLIRDPRAYDDKELVFSRAAHTTDRDAGDTVAMFGRLAK